MNNKLNTNDLDYLFSAVLELQTKDECYNFFKDLCTIQELKAISQRLRVAKLLSENMVYNNIVNETGASTATISRVNRSLQDGNDGYRVVFERMEKHK